MTDKEEIPTLFTSEISQHLKCLVCSNLYKDPVINISCGHTFCKACATSTSTCPNDGSVCDPNQLVVNRLVVGQIDDLLIHCRHGLMKENDQYVPDPSGCQQKIQYGSRHEHEAECEFVPVSCPNRSCHLKFRKSELEEHLKVCAFKRCSHFDKGCEFEGRLEDVTNHELTCGYRGLPKTVGSDEVQHRTLALEETNRELQTQVSSLTMRVAQLEAANECQQGQLTECRGSLMELHQKFDKLALSVDQLLSVRSRRSPGNHSEGRPRSSSSSVCLTGINERRSSFRKSVSGSPPSTARHEKWAMPFQFKCIGTLRGHQNIVWCMASSDKKRLYSAGSDSTIKVWDLENLQRGCIKTMQGHSNAIQCMTIGENFLYTGGHDNSIFCWSLEDYSKANCVQNAHDNIICAMILVGEFLFTASFSLIKVWDAQTMVHKRTIDRLHHWVRALALNPDRDKLFSGSHNSIDIWNVTEPFSLKGKVDHQFGSIYSLAITNKYIIAGTYNNNVQIFDGVHYNHVQQLTMHIGRVQYLVTSPSGRFLFSASVDKTIQVWNLENMLPIQTLQRHEGSVNTLVLHRDFLFSGSEDKEIKVFMYFQMQMGFALNT